MTRRGYASDLRAYLRWLGDRPALAVTDRDINEYRNWMAQVVGVDGEPSRGGDPRFAPTTIARRLSVVRNFYAYAARRGAIAVSPALNIANPKINREPRGKALTATQLKRLLETAKGAGHDEDLIVCLLALNGLRVNEVCSADARRLERQGDDGFFLKVKGKGTDYVDIPLHPRAARCVVVLHGDRRRGPLVTRPDRQWARWHSDETPPRRRYSQQDVGRLLDELGAAAGIVVGAGDPGDATRLAKLHPHILRHTFVTLLLDEGISLAAVQDAARHESADTTRLYDRKRGRYANHPARALNF